MYKAYAQKDCPEADSLCRKTEILLEVAFKFRNVCNIFFIETEDLKSLERTFLEIAMSIGQDLLSIRFPHSDLAALWRSYEPAERVRAFKTWLGHPSNQASLFIVDDLDGHKGETLIRAALPREAQVILYSTRDPNLIGSLGRDSQSYYIPTMKDDEMALLMINTMHRSGGVYPSAEISKENLKAIARVVHGHPLGACRAILYIFHVLAQETKSRETESSARAFLEMFNGPEWESRLRFLEYKPTTIGLSLKETFAISMERIHRHQIEATRLLELLAFLCGKTQALNFRVFLGLERPWLNELQAILPDYDLFASRLKGQGEILAELENVSIGVRPDVSTPLQIHPLWLECIQQGVGHEGRVRWIRQIIILCHGSYARGQKVESLSLQPFLQNACDIAARFRVGFDELLESQELRSWVSTVKETLGDLFNDQSSVSSSSDATHTAQTTEDQISKEFNITNRLGEVPQHFRDMVNLRDSCDEAAKALAPLNTTKLSEEAFTSWRQQYITLLRRLKSVEESGQDLSVNLHLETYDLLLDMAPKLKHVKPRLGEQLRARRDEIQRQNSLAEAATDRTDR